MIQITEDYAAHFYDKYINKHEGRYLTGNRIQIQLLTLPFVLRDLIAPVMNLLLVNAVLRNMLHNMCYVTCVT
jgi:hypothetical protein